MSVNSTEGGNQGQESGTATQGQGQESSQGVQGGQGQESGTQEQGNQQGTPPEAFDFSTIQDPGMRAWAEKVDRDAREAREQAARYRTERNASQQEAQSLRQQNETEQERQTREANERQERLDALEAENRTLKVGAAITTAATEAKAFNPALVAQMLDAKVTLGDDGKPTNLQALLTDLRQSDPYLFKRAQNDAGEGGGQQGQPTASMNDVIRNAARARQGRTTSN